MPAVKKYYAYDYNMDSTARKIKYDEYNDKKIVRPNKNVNKKSQISNKAKVSSILWILFAFAIFMVVVYRYNIINEKNLQVQSLKKQLATTQAQEATSQVEVEQSTDLNTIESYAKQQLGMQKPGKNQIVYVDNSENVSVKSVDNTTLVDKFVNKVKEIIKQVF